MDGTDKLKNYLIELDQALTHSSLSKCQQKMETQGGMIADLLTFATRPDSEYKLSNDSYVLRFDPYNLNLQRKTKPAAKSRGEWESAHAWANEHAQGIAIRIEALLSNALADATPATEEEKIRFVTKPVGDNKFTYYFLFEERNLPGNRKLAADKVEGFVTNLCRNPYSRESSIGHEWELARKDVACELFQKAKQLVGGKPPPDFLGWFGEIHEIRGRFLQKVFSMEGDVARQYRSMRDDLNKRISEAVQWGPSWTVSTNLLVGLGVAGGILAAILGLMPKVDKSTVGVFAALPVFCVTALAAFKMPDRAQWYREMMVQGKALLSRIPERPRPEEVDHLAKAHADLVTRVEASRKIVFRALISNHQHSGLP